MDQGSAPPTPNDGQAPVGRNGSPLASVWFVKVLLLMAALSVYVPFASQTEGHYKDFASQWIVTRLAVTGRADQMYDIAAQRQVGQYIPPDKLKLETPYMDRAGVSPYPPVLYFLYWPLGRMAPARAQWLVAEACVVLAAVTAWGISRGTGGRMDLLTAWVAILYFPGFFYTFALGQNALVLLTLVTLGWAALARSRNLLGGLVWGILVYKIHWLVAVGWLPALWGRWRTYLGMAVSASLLVAATTVAFGPKVWSDWYRSAAAMRRVYAETEFREDILGKALDLRALFHRYLPGETADWFGWCALAVVGIVTLGVYLRNVGPTRRRPDDPSAVCLLYCCCLISPYTFYYDQTAALLPTLLFWSYRSLLSAAFFWGLVVLVALFYLGLPLMDFWPDRWNGPPFATFALLGLWGLSLTLCRTRTEE